MQSNSPTPEESGSDPEQLRATDTFVDSASPNSKPAAQSWLAPEMRGTLVRGLLLAVFVIAASVVLPFFRPPADPDDGKPKDNLTPDNRPAEAGSARQESR